MQTLLAIASILVLLLAAGIALLNWGCVIAGFHLQRLGIQRHVSTVPLVVQLLVWIAVVLSSRLTHPLLPMWCFWMVALMDAALLQLVCRPLFLLHRRVSNRPVAPR